MERFTERYDKILKETNDEQPGIGMMDNKSDEWSVEISSNEKKERNAYLPKWFIKIGELGVEKI